MGKGGGAFLVAPTVPANLKARPCFGWGCGGGGAGGLSSRKGMMGSSRRLQGSKGSVQWSFCWGSGQPWFTMRGAAASPPRVTNTTLVFQQTFALWASFWHSDKIRFLSNPCGQFLRPTRLNLNFPLPLYEGNFPFSLTDVSLVPAWF